MLNGTVKQDPVQGPGLMLPLCLLLLLSFHSYPHALASWTEWRGDPSHMAVEEGEVPGIGELIWYYQTGDQVLSSPVFHEGSLLIGSDDGDLYCMDQDTGELLWKYKTGSSIQATPLVKEDRAYFGSFDRNFYCISLPPAGSGGTGTLVWNITLHGQVISSCHWYDDGLIIADNWGYLYSIDDEGGLRWEIALTEMDIWGSPLVIEDKGRAIIGDVDGNLWLVDLDNGDVVWDRSFGVDTEFYSSGTYRDGLYYIPGGMDEKFYAIRVLDGEVIWSFDIGIASYSTPVISDDRIYFGSYGFLWCIPLNDTDGDGNISMDEVLFQSSINDYQGGSSPLLAGGEVFIGSDDWHLYCFDSDTGEELWTFKTGGYVYSSPALHDERIYFGSSDRSIYCIGKRPPGLVMNARPDIREMTSDNMTAIRIKVTDEEGNPIDGARITFTSSAGFIAFDSEGNTRVDHMTDASGELIVFYFPVQVSSRSTIDIGINAQREGLREASSFVQIIVEPGEKGPFSQDENAMDTSKRVILTAIIISFIFLNLILLSVSMIWSMRNRNEEKEASP
ncbi:MAG: PQQ-binding-like beta-propeller repeat protein [Candidatus Thermoplasmatota archaeon]|nr:PQQ-binding-like beta-propeller repeat protein [Candidatus Thermoplasmatota archaeon]